MNEQFEKLREQALKEVDYLLETEGSENGAVMYREHLAMVNQRFAELIVKECVDICNQAVQQSQHTRDLLKEDELAEKMVAHGATAQAQRLAASIQQHFGVGQ